VGDYSDPPFCVGELATVFLKQGMPNRIFGAASLSEWWSRHTSGVDYCTVSIHTTGVVGCREHPRSFLLVI
jgi:hypothetical protein